ncbi:midasin protein [Trifolium repens]|nr:midasin protein [Trifolium repens]
MGCFRAIARNFVDKAVTLLRFVPNLRSNTVDDAMEVDSDIVLDDVGNFVEYYVEQGRGLDLHEYVCLAFCRALEMSCFSLSSVLSYFKFAPAPFERFSGKQDMVDESHGLLVARISYRFLLLKPEIFSKLWDWSCFLELQPCKSDMIWCRGQILRVVLKSGSRANECLNIEAQEASWCLLRWEEFCGETSLEKAGWFVEPTADYMISNLTFQQENTIADEPVVDLLKFLTNKLDAVVVKARLPSGSNPLQQLVLIIADGRSHEKENLKRCVRDAIASNRMEASFEGEKMKFSKYMDSYPFPYYIVLRNIEALPRTLANLLRQWLELMQNSN